MQSLTGVDFVCRIKTYKPVITKTPTKAAANTEFRIV